MANVSIVCIFVDLVSPHRDSKTSVVSLLSRNAHQRSTVQKATLQEVCLGQEQEMEAWLAMEANPQWRPKRMLQSILHSQFSMFYPMLRMLRPLISSLMPLVVNTMTHREASQWCKSFHPIPRTCKYSPKTRFLPAEILLAKWVNWVKSLILNSFWWGSRTRLEITWPCTKVNNQWIQGKKAS